MNNKDRKIQLFLQIFFLIIGIYVISDSLTAFYSDRLPADVFDFYNQDIPVFYLSAGFIAGIASLISSLALWTRLSWAYAFSLFTSGFLLCYNLEGMGRAIYRNPYEVIPMVIIVIVILQSFPFLIKRTNRHM